MTAVRKIGMTPPWRTTWRAFMGAVKGATHGVVP
jgi:hypothetical protein